MSKEVPKRLAPTPETLRELYLRSGNQCAFPGCPERFVDTDGTIVGEICHIRAAMPGGERFDPKMTNEQRRAYENLILLCRKHHVVTDNVKVYTVERMQKMKADHESRFSDVIQRMESSFVDYTQAQTQTKAQSGQSLNAFTKWNLPPDELAETMQSINGFFERFVGVPRTTLEFISIVVERGEDSFLRHSVRALYHDIVEACRLDEQTVLKHVQILERHKLGLVEDDEGIEIVISGADWPMWETLRNYARAKGFPMRELIVEGRLDLLD